MGSSPLRKMLIFIAARAACGAISQSLGAPSADIWSSSAFTWVSSDIDDPSIFHERLLERGRRFLHGFERLRQHRLQIEEAVHHVGIVGNGDRHARSAELVGV